LKLLFKHYIFNSVSKFLIGNTEAKNSFDFFGFLGHLHPLIVHLPIGILLFVCLLELLAFKSFDKYRPTIAFGLYIGTISAVFAIVFGLLLAQTQETSGQTLDNHKIGGFVTAGLLVLSSYLLWSIQSKNKVNFIHFYRGSLFLAILGIIITGHFGGTLTHGEGYLTESLNPKIKTENNSLLAYGSVSDSLSPENQLKLNAQVRAIFAHNCYKCHSSNKQEGKLRLDQKLFVFTGGKNGKIIVKGKSAESELIRRISLPKGHKEAMPGKGKPLSVEEIALLRFWVDKGAPWPENSLQPNLFRVAKMELSKPVLPLNSSYKNPIDVWVDVYFKKNKIVWQAQIEDKYYLRRVYLDIVGLFPTPQETEAYITDSNPDKKVILVRKLLDNKEAYTQHWLTFWNDNLRNDYSGTGFITNGRYQITDWLYTSLLYNKPYDIFAKELLNPSEKSKGFISGIAWRGTINASQRTEMQAAQNVSQVLLGLNLKCASCHDSFISDWKLKDAYAFANIFADSTLEINRCDKPTGQFAETKLLWQNLGKIDNTGKRAKKLQQMATGLVQPANGRLYRTLVNRVWKQMMGRGIVEPVDEMDNEPWSQELLDWLAADFIEKKYDIKELIFAIATSKIYSSQSSTYKSQLALYDNNFKFTGMARRRLTAEQFSDAVSQIILPVFNKNDIKYKAENKNKPFENPFVRASIVANNRFLTALGRPNREIVATSRDSQASILQALELTNGEKLNFVLACGAEEWLISYKDTDVLITEFYKKTLGRQPNQKERNIALQALGKSPKPEQIQDFFWAIILLPEFQLIY
jgi:uncharacterized membrane protein/mono/diheme cytochrome c family protein